MDRTFKFGLLVFLALFLTLFWEQGQNGRFVAVEGDWKEVLDSRTGRLYLSRPCPWPGGSGPGCLNTNDPPSGEKKGGAR